MWGGVCPVGKEVVALVGYVVVLESPDGSRRFYVTWDFRGRSKEEIARDEAEELKRKGSLDVVVAVTDVDTSPRF